MSEGRSQPPNWRDPAIYRELARLDRAALMWEWLRRDPAYVRWYACASEATRGGQSGEATRKWGLHFR